jgi:Flp pilus assembly protein TadB
MILVGPIFAGIGGFYVVLLASRWGQGLMNLFRRRTGQDANAGDGRKWFRRYLIAAAALMVIVGVAIAAYGATQLAR